MSYREQYIPFKAALKLFKEIKFMLGFSTDSHETYYDHTDIRLFSGIPWKNH